MNNCILFNFDFQDAFNNEILPFLLISVLNNIERYTIGTSKQKCRNSKIIDIIISYVISIWWHGAGSINVTICKQSGQPSLEHVVFLIVHNAAQVHCISIETTIVF